MQRMSFIISVAGYLVAGNAPAGAHEFWIEPSTFRPSPGAVFRVSLKHGERFVGEPVLRNPPDIDRFVLVSALGETAVMGRPGYPANFVRCEKPGHALIGYLSRGRYHELEAERFEEYLREEGLEQIIHSRSQLGETHKSGHEAYVRCAKALVTVGDKNSDEFARLLGLPLEIVPEASPATLRPGSKLRVRILFRGQPLQGAKVVCVNKDDPQELIHGVSDDQGRAQFALPRVGVWMVTTIHMTRAPVQDNADWQSFWASLTFAVPPPARGFLAKTDGDAPQ